MTSLGGLSISPTGRKARNYPENGCLHKAARRAGPGAPSTAGGKKSDTRPFHHHRVESQPMHKPAILTAALLLVVSLQAVAAEPKETKTASGIGITTLKEGSGESPK